MVESGCQQQGNQGTFPAPGGGGFSPLPLLTRRSSCRKVRVKKSISTMLQEQIPHTGLPHARPGGVTEGPGAGQQAGPWASLVEEAGVDAIAGLQVLVDGVGQLHQPGKALRPRLRGSPVHTDLVALTSWPTPSLPSPAARPSPSGTCSRGLLAFRSLSYHSRLPLCKTSHQDSVANGGA